MLGVGGNSKLNISYICDMTELNSIKKILTQLKPELIEKYHVSSIGLFGSIVRDDFTSSSDIDIIVDFSKPIGIEFVDLADLIEMKLKKNVDLVSKNGVKPKYYRQIESEIIYV
ncbi:MAG TPA: nucleotidyltransferase family protein [Ferruginibacter sp.]|nr:nucleotidyltransferase family protein [Ferruginibacter sp.]